MAYLSCVSPTFSYISTTTHKIHPLKADRKVRIAGSDRGYIYTINLGQKCVRHWGMDFPLRCSGVHHISLHWALLGCSLEYKATACLSQVPVWRITAVLIMPVQDVLSTYPEYGCSKLFLHVSTACAHCVISQKTAIFIHQHHCENLKSHYCIFCPHFYASWLGTLGRENFILF